MNNHSHFNNPGQQGFTLLELLVVVSLLASMAGIAAVAMDGYEQKAQEQLVYTEMKQIANAIHRFKEDTGYYPKTGVFVDNGQAESLSWLFSPPTVSGGVPSMQWNAQTGRGWHGPYLTPESRESLSTADCDLEVVGTSSLLAALSDPFERQRTYTSGDQCFVVRDKGHWVARASAGVPYRYQTDYASSWHQQCQSGSNTCIALISAGPNGIFESGSQSDDSVSVLRVDQ